MMHFHDNAEHTIGESPPSEFFRSTVVDLGYGGVHTADVMSRNEASTSLHWRECVELRISVNGKRTEHNLYIQQTITDDHVKRNVRNESRSVCVLNRYRDGGGYEVEV